MFWNKDQSLGQKKIALVRQSESIPENARFRLGPVLFVSLNIPGSNNNWTRTGEPSPEYLARNPLVLQWLKEGFAIAQHQGLAGIVLLFQADPDFTNFALGMPQPSYRDFLDLLREETIKFPGQVVAVHGDSHISLIDKPLRDKRGGQITNFTRVETLGYPAMGWTRISGYSMIQFQTTISGRFLRHHRDGGRVRVRFPLHWPGESTSPCR